MSIKENKGKIVVILGTTASGKTGLAVKLARKYGGEIIGADSRQVYRGMDIGSGKDLIDYAATDNEAAVSYHLIDVVEPNEQYDIARYQREAYEAIDDCLERGVLPILCGGSGLYLQAVVDGYELSSKKPTDERVELENLELAELQALLKKKNAVFFTKLNNSDLNNKRRLVRYLEVFGRTGEVTRPKSKARYESLIIGLEWPREIIKQRIEKRLLDRLNNENLIGEVERLNNEGVSWQRLEKFGLEYRFAARYLQNKLSYEEMIEQLLAETYRFAKRQVTWFKRWEKQGIKINWIKKESEARELIDDFLS